MGGECGKGGASPGPEREARYRWAAQLSAGRRVLDAACGGGWGTAVLAASAAAAVGVDFSPAAISDARREHGAVADFHEGDLRSLPFGDAEFDGVVCFEAIAHVADPAQALDELRRVLVPRGLLLISAPNPDVYPAGNPLHLSAIPPKELELLLHARFANVAVHRQQSYVASLLADESLLAHEDPAREIAARVIKAAGGPAGSELHAVAAATDGELPPPPAILALGEDQDRAAQEARLKEWQDRAVQAEAEALALRNELRGR